LYSLARNRPLTHLVEEQAHRWLLEKAKARASPRRPVVTLSRQPGARGEELARELAESLGLQIFDQEIPQRIADAAHLRAQAVRLLDERERSLIMDWLGPYTKEDYLTHYEYLHYLIAVIAAISHQGGAIVVGRGAHILLRQGEALRVRVVAPIKSRIAVVSACEGISERAAHERIAAVEKERRAFLKQYFRAKYDETGQYDLVVNTGSLGIDGAVEAIRGPFLRMSVATPA
jgi:hypothetical protein